MGNTDWGQYGILGLMFGLLLWWYRKTDAKRDKEAQSRLDEIKKIHETHTQELYTARQDFLKEVKEIASQHNALVDKITERFDATQKQSNKTLGTHSMILAGLKALLEHTLKQNK